MDVKSRKPNSFKSYPIKTRLVFYIGLIIILILISVAGMINALKVCPFMVTPYVLILLILFVAVIILIIILLFQSQEKNQYGKLQCLLEKSLYMQICYQLKLYEVSVDNSEDIIFPDREITDNGFRIEALPGLSERLLNAIDDFNGILYRKRTQLVIEESYLKSGWVYYQVSQDFRKSRIKNV